MVFVKVPATSANLGPGFDTFGMALDLFLEVEVNAIKDSAKVSFIGVGKEFLQSKPGDNLVIKAINTVFKKAGKEPPELQIVIKNDIPVGKGLGSSAAAITAGIYAANFLLGEMFSKEQLVRWAVEMEGHPDNIIPAVEGGLTTAMLFEDNVYYQKIKVPEKLEIIAAVPDFYLPTEKSRSVIPDKAELKDTVINLQRACFFLASICNNDFKHLDIAMDDIIYQNYRKQFIPGFDLVLQKAKEAGALGAALSGAGPSVIALSMGRKKEIGEAMYEAFKLHGINSQILHLKPYKEGILCSDK